MLKSVFQFLKKYKQLQLVVLSIIVGGALDVTSHHTAAHLVLGISAIANVFPLAWGMIEDFRGGSYGLDILAITAIVSAVLLHEYWAAMVVVLMLTGGEALEDYAEGRAKNELSELLKRKPKKAHLLRGTTRTDVPVSQIKAGDKLVILPGEVVPVDAEVIEGASSFDESSLTGESLPVVKQIGDKLLSGSVNIEGAITVKALHTAADSQYEQIIKLVKAAASSQSPFVRLADRYSIPFTATAFIIAGSVWFMTGHAIRFLEVIVVATPCPLLLGAPIALISGMSRAAKHGIIVKNGAAMERLAEVQTVAFDKTGTLTRGVPVVDKIQTFNNFKADDVLACAAALETNSNHVLARAILTVADQKKIGHKPAKQVKESSGRGLSGRVGGKVALLGRLNYLQDEGVRLPKANLSVEKTATYVAINGELAGMITFVDEIRPQTKPMLQRLKAVGIKQILMVTGDNKAVAQAIAKKFGINNVVSEALPGDKIRAIEEVSAKPVAFVGDGVNDAPVLTAADVGIALGARGSTAASESADVVIMLDDVGRVANAFEISKRTFFIAKQSILIGIFISLGLMGVFATGHFKPVLGAALQEVVDVAVIFNALRAHGSFRKSEVVQ